MSVISDGVGQGMTLTEAMFKQLRKSMGLTRCRWPSPDRDDRCRFCGWPLTWAGGAPGQIEGHWRHRRPKLSTLSRWETHLIGSGSARSSTNDVDPRSDALRHNVRLRKTPVTVEEWAIWKAAHHAS